MILLMERQLNIYTYAYWWSVEWAHNWITLALSCTQSIDCWWTLVLFLCLFLFLILSPIVLSNVNDDCQIDLSFLYHLLLVREIGLGERKHSSPWPGEIIKLDQLGTRRIFSHERFDRVWAMVNCKSIDESEQHIIKVNWPRTKIRFTYHTWVWWWTIKENWIHRLFLYPPKARKWSQPSPIVWFSKLESIGDVI